MSASMNRHTLIGNVGKIETKTLNSGTKVCNIALATSESYKNDKGEEVEATEWHDLCVWNKQAEFCEKFVHKGDKIFAEGKVKAGEWTDQQGVKHRAKETYVNDVKLLSKAKPKEDPGEQSNAQQGPPRTRSTPKAQKTTQEEKPVATDDDVLPWDKK